jgi:hypothetical protein
LLKTPAELRNVRICALLTLPADGSGHE